MIKDSFEAFSSRFVGVSESLTLSLNSRVQKLVSDGVDIINLTTGEPDFDVPNEAKQAVFRAVTANESRYTPVAGFFELRDLVANKTNNQQTTLKEKWNSSNVVISHGGKQALFNVFMAILNPGDEVLIPAPYWLSYPDMVRIAGGTPRIINTRIEDGFKITPDILNKVLSVGKTPKVIIFNSPSNPTGALYSNEEFAALGRVLLNNKKTDSKSGNTWIISDEVYDRIILGDNKFCSFLNAVPEFREKTVTINAMSKSAPMTGWRVGWSVAPKALTDLLIILQGQSTSGVSALSQRASIAVLKLNQEKFSYQIESYTKRCAQTLEILGNSGKIKVMAPSGAFYYFIGIKECLGKGENDIAFAERLVQEANVAVVPGASFGGEGFVRLSFATDEASLKKGCERFIKYVGN